VAAKPVAETSGAGEPGDIADLDCRSIRFGTDVGRRGERCSEQLKSGEKTKDEKSNGPKNTAVCERSVDATPGQRARFDARHP